ncbi:patatin-like phospholipase family protein [Epibacterium sp. MM17-32]|uniref:patatin-like phospholipase family protein n=1 Tax=Epibacterium sp. MM17-32 TaxID=2917734 RepID=UPI001EF51221|nr:patatin-like phospholipase family protein [Epibacterium sp. MM17-32]MCG7626445.1 patatin-like phospholipase family protein [Epibacterium sp. MM17-32]
MVKRINLALQGGGAHGAFTWGVLDRLLEDEALDIAAITGTSAGALNGAALKAGMARDGRAGAKASLDRLWARMGAVGDMRMANWIAGVDASPLLNTLKVMAPFSPIEAMSQAVSPYSYGPFYRNPLRPVVEQFDFGEVCADAGPDLYICATSVQTGKVRVFSGTEVSTDAILASACLPNLFQAIELPNPKTGQTEAYWDGGYTGNPALFPLFRDDLPDDVVVVNINPLVRAEVPKTAHDIQNRVNEISFNSSLLRELRAISFVQRLIEDGTMEQGRMKRVLVHMIADDDLMTRLSVTTKLIPIPQILHMLKTAGREAAEGFLDQHMNDLGHRQTVDLGAMFG